MHVEGCDSQYSLISFTWQCMKFILISETLCTSDVQGLSSLRNVMAPKIVVAQKMAETFSSMPLDEWTHFSSLSALLGTPGQANYAAANLQINEFSHQQEGSGKPV